MADSTVGKILAIATRERSRAPMRELSEVEAVVGGALAGEEGRKAERGLFLLASGQWAEVTRELDADLPWHTRRANVLVESDSLTHLVGRTIRIGEAEVAITKESGPCARMDELHSGLREALKPNCRGGVYGHIVNGGMIRVGDVVALSSDAD